MKKILVLGISAILALGIAACGKTTPSNSLNPDDTGSTTHTHEYGEWVVTKEATLTANGEKERTCACGEKETEIIPQLKYQRIDADGKVNPEGAYIYFGFYPQTYVSDKDIIAKLDELTVDATTNYINYGNEQYAKVEKAKTANNATNYTFSNDETIVNGQTYYFKVEPIKWRILNPTATDGTAMLFSENILVNKAYDSDANNYADSEIRAWLTGEFYNKTFTEAQKEIIKTTEVDNSVASTGDESNPYTSDTPTNDKVFLLSYKEATTEAYGFTSQDRSDTARVKYGTDYAKAQGLWIWTEAGVNKASWWWLRTPHNSVSQNARMVSYDGNITNRTVDETIVGVVPALNITL